LSKEILRENTKIKLLSKEQIVTAIERLMRFKETETKYLRVFRGIISNNLIEPKFKKSELDGMDYVVLRDFTQSILNQSIEAVGFEPPADYRINEQIREWENSLFTLDSKTQNLLDNKINFAPILPPVAEKRGGSLKFPPKKIILTEGITEEILLPEFARICGCDFDKNAIHIISAGGKNQVVKYFYRLYENLKIPVFILLDNDALNNCDEIKPKLRPGDKIHLISKGEFEDLLPLPLIKRTLNYELKNFYKVEDKDLVQDLPMAKILEDFFKRSGLSEFKKADFAHLVKKNILSETDVSDEIKNIIYELG